MAQRAMILTVAMLVGFVNFAFAKGSRGHRANSSDSVLMLSKPAHLKQSVYFQVLMPLREMCLMDDGVVRTRQMQKLFLLENPEDARSGYVAIGEDYLVADVEDEGQLCDAANMESCVRGAEGIQGERGVVGRYFNISLRQESQSELRRVLMNGANGLQKCSN